jgi:hypothetical protein
MKKSKLNTTRRLIQSIFNHLVDNESFLLGLTNIKNHDNIPSITRSMSVCWPLPGQKTGAQPGELVDLGLSAFFHDLGKLKHRWKS